MQIDARVLLRDTATVEFAKEVSYPDAKQREAIAAAD